MSSCCFMKWLSKGQGQDISVVTQVYVSGFLRCWAIIWYCPWSVINVRGEKDRERLKDFSGILHQNNLSQTNIQSEIYVGGIGDLTLARASPINLRVVGKLMTWPWILLRLERTSFSDQSIYVKDIRGCSHITSSKIGGSWIPPPPSVSNGQHLPDAAFVLQFLT